MEPAFPVPAINKDVLSEGKQQLASKANVHDSLANARVYNTLHYAI